MAVVRLKRHFSEDPVDTLLLACKKRKTENDHLTSIFKFAATVSDQDENVSKYLSKEFRSPDVKPAYKAHNITNITDKLRAENKLFLQNSRLKVVNCFRALSDSANLDGPSSSDERLTIVDIESLPLVKSDASETTIEEPQKYVYDIYYADDCKLDEKMLENPISCHILDELVFEDCADDVYDNEEDSDDSNDENNWRNDYPDEEEPDSIGEEDMRMACQMDGLHLSETNSLSSDAGEEDLVYGMDDPDFLPEGINGRYYSVDYTAYKKRVAKDLDSDASENSDFFYCGSDPESDRS